MSSDGLNCLKNLLQIMCCDHEINAIEKQFLANAAKALHVNVADWNALLKEVVKDGSEIYPITNRSKAESTLKAMAAMAKSDKEINEEEKQLLMTFAKSIGLTKEQWKQMLSKIDMTTLFEPFWKSVGQIAVLKDGFEAVNAFVATAAENNAAARIMTIAEYLKQPGASDEVVCFHASENKERSLQICSALLKKQGDRVACVLTRFQGLQVKYLRELGLKKCIIEPAYAKDIADLFRNDV